MSKGIFSTALLGIDLLLDPSATMPVGEGYALSLENADIVTHPKLFDEQ